MPEMDPAGVLEELLEAGGHALALRVHREECGCTGWPEDCAAAYGRGPWEIDVDPRDLVAILAAHEAMVRERCARELLEWADAQESSATFNTAQRRRRLHLHAAARHIAPKISPGQLVQEIADGTAIVVGCPSLDEKPATPPASPAPQAPQGAAGSGPGSGELRDWIAEALTEWVQQVAGSQRTLALAPAALAAITENSRHRADAVMTVVQPVLDRLRTELEIAEAGRVSWKERAEQVEVYAGRCSAWAREAADQRDRLRLAWESARRGRRIARQERDRLRGQRNAVRLAVRAAVELLETEDWTGGPEDRQALFEALGEVDQHCPVCWRLHGTWCAPYGGTGYAARTAPDEPGPARTDGTESETTETKPAPTPCGNQMPGEPRVRCGLPEGHETHTSYENGAAWRTYVHETTPEQAWADLVAAIREGLELDHVIDDDDEIAMQDGSDRYVAAIVVIGNIAVRVAALVGAADAATAMWQERAEMAEDRLRTVTASATRSDARADDAEAARDRWRSRGQEAEAERDRLAAELGEMQTIAAERSAACGRAERELNYVGDVMTSVRAQLQDAEKYAGWARRAEEERDWLRAQVERAEAILRPLIDQNIPIVGVNYIAAALRPDEPGPARTDGSGRDPLAARPRDYVLADQTPEEKP